MDVLLLDIGPDAGPLPATTPVDETFASWFPVPHQAAPVPTPGGVGTTPVADGVLLEWDAVPGDGVVYLVERAVSPQGPWTEVIRTTATRYLYSAAVGANYHFRVTVLIHGRPGAGAVVDGAPKPLPTVAQLVALQEQLEQAKADRVAGDLLAIETAGLDATAKAVAARDAAIARADALAAEISEIVGAPEWDAATAYNAGWLVRYGGALYRARIDTQGAAPDVLPSPWLKLGDYASVGEALAANIVETKTVAAALGVETARLDVLLARMPATGNIVNEARVIAAESAAADANRTTAERVAVVEAKQAAPNFSSVLTWEFVNAAQLTPAYNGFSTVRAGFSSFVAPSSYGATAFSATGFDPNLLSPTFSLDGKSANIVRALVRRRSGTSAWAGALYWATTSHGITSAHNAGTASAVPVRSGGDSWHIIEWDLTNNDDWNKSTITQLRFTFDLDAPSTVDIRSISIGISNGTAASSASVTAVEKASVDRDGVLAENIVTATAAANDAKSAATQALTATGNQATAITAVQAQQLLDAFSATISWDFRGTTSGWTFANAAAGVFPVVTNNGIGVDNTAFDPRYASPVVNLDGRKSYIVRAMIRRRVAGNWDGGLFWRTPNHGISGSYRAQAAVAAGGGWQIVEWDLSGNDDWRNSTITQIWLDLEASGNTITDVRWVAIGNKTTAGDVGGGGAAAVTQELRAGLSTTTGRMEAIAGLAIRADGKSIGYRFANDGVVGRLDFVGDAIAFFPPDGAASGMEFSPGVGGLSRRFGPGWQHIESAIPFGPDGLVEYFGPNVGIGNASKANATRWVAANGDNGLNGNVPGQGSIQTTNKAIRVYHPNGQLAVAIGLDI